MGTGLVEMTAQPHTGCAKFTGHYGPDATRFVNSTRGRAQRFRGVNARAVEGGAVRPGDAITKDA